LSDLWPRLRDTLFGLDPRSLALFRIGLGLTLLVDLAGRWPDLVAHYTDDGVLPRGLVFVSVPVCVHALDGSAAFEAVLFLIQAAFATAMVLGYRTQLATFLSWLLLLSLHARNPLVLHAGDLLERLLLFWAIFLPLGARYSLDARDAREPPSPVASVAAAALTLQIVMMYWFGLAARSDPAWWGEGTAVARALNLDFYATSFGRWLRDLPPEVLRAATAGTVAVEGLGPLLLLLSGRMGRLRTAVVAVMIVFHILLGLALRLGTFPLVCVVAWLPFLPPWFWESVDPRLRRLLRQPGPGPAKEPLPAPCGLSPLSAVIVVLCLIYVFAYNLLALGKPATSAALVRGLGLDQAWPMFAPAPTQEDGWYVVRASLRDGSTVDPFRDGPVSWDKPDMVSATYPSARWAAYASALLNPANAALRPYFGDYLRRRWDAEHPDSQAAERVEVYYMLRLVQPDHRATATEKVLLARVP
jgi:hypothetical protein